MTAKRTVLIVDLNNFAHYPTLAVGYLIAALREAGHDVHLLSPLAFRLPTMPERQESWWQYVQRRVYFSTHPAMSTTRDALASARRRWLSRPDPHLPERAARAMDALRPDVLLLSAYLDFGSAVEGIARLAKTRGVPVLLGGPGFNMDEVAARWVRLPGLSAIVAAEVDRTLPRIVEALLCGDDLSAFPGVYLPDGRRGPAAEPLTDMASLPVPDLADFPWHLYPNPIVPVMASRGCNWGNCTFCSDVRVVNGMSFRARPARAVLDEIERQAGRHGTKDVIFLDIKLNGDLALWRGIIDGFQSRLPGGRWIATVHVQASGENGLTREELHLAARAGLTRLSFGFETGSQRLNDAMAKGTSIERTARFLADAHDAGISVRATAIVGYPGETADDLDRTVRFLDEHGHYLDRIRLNRFTPSPGTRFHELVERSPQRFPDLVEVRWDYQLRRGEYRLAGATDAEYRQAKARLLRAVHRINRRPLRPVAQEFDGLM